MTISTILKQLPKMHLDTLMAAFEEEVSAYVEYSPGRFVGVNTDSIPHLECDQQAGSWREGRIVHATLP